MLVYGDQAATCSTRSVLADLRQQAQALAHGERGILWHQACVALFIKAAGLLQGIADVAFAAAGHDGLSSTQSALMASLRAMAGAVEASWSSGFVQQNEPDMTPLALLGAQQLPEMIAIRRCEGYAFYALYPEQYLAAARALPRGASVIGLRSIGTGLAASVAAVCHAELVCTLRPVGDVYDRTVAIGPQLHAAIHARRGGTFAIVDEGPGRSGSSMGGVADYLEKHGVAPERIIFMPNHKGNLGPHARADHRRRWQRATRLTAGFEQLFIDQADGLPLAAWFEDLTGRATEPLKDLSGGQWRALSSAQAAVPADPSREARKYLLQSSTGPYLLKFIGLDAEATAKFDRAQRLHAAGFSPEPLGVRHGFLVERWMSAPPVTADADIWPSIARYLAWRAAAFPAMSQGASLQTLLSVARYNIRQAVGTTADALFEPWPDARVAALQASVRPIFVDGRMHPWEWIARAAGILKTDAIDHAQAHDLVGCQDVAWDVAGAIVEFEASTVQRDNLVRAVMGLCPDAGSLTALMTLCYIGFQIGWWDLASDRASAALRRAFYLRRIEALLRSGADRL